MIHRIDSSKSPAEAGKALEAAAPRHKFGVLAVHDLQGKMKEKGLDFRQACLVYEVCNPQQAKRVLEANIDISTALPCRIAIYQKGTGSTLATLRPTLLLEMFGTPGLKAVAADVEKALVEMMAEAAA
jgi:uncharacterized protein (DUF302 family)